MSSIVPPAPEPKTPLGIHRLLSPSAAVRVSPLCLGAMNFGNAWEDWLGKCDKTTSFEILDSFFESGGNFIDTSNNYQNGESEQWIGEWMEKRGNRDQMVIATKFTMDYRNAHRDKEIQSNFQGNHTKSLHVSLRDSLKKLKTDYIDLLYVHWWDFSTSIEEIMQSLNTMIHQGKVLYLGISDTPAWIVSKANQYARDHGLRPFSVYQGRWSAAHRDFERDIILMCEAEGMGLAPWGALGGGQFKTEEQRKSAQGRSELFPLTEEVAKISKTLEAIESIAKKKKTVITSVALAYVIHKTPNVIPIVGGRKVEHLKSNIEALKLKLTQEDLDEIDNAAPFDVGFPMDFLFMGQPYKTTLQTSDIPHLKANAHIQMPKKPSPVSPQ